jgi:hypothetical protein
MFRLNPTRPPWTRSMDVTLHYTERLVRQAVARFCWRSIGPLYVVSLLAMIAFVALSIGAGNRSWPLGVAGTVLIAGLAVPVLLYRNQLSAALTRFRALEGQPATFRATDRLVSIRSAGGMIEFPWRAITGIWRYDDCWLLLTGPHFLTFPLVGVSSEAQAYLIERVLANGGKIA